MNPRILHTLNKDPLHPRSQACLSALHPGDTLLLLENGANLLAHETLRTQLLALTDIHLAVIDLDLRARGLQPRLPTGVKSIDYTQFVAMTLDHDKVINW